MSKKIFALCPSILKQKEAMDKHCFGDCGRILVGILEIDGGCFVPCREENCKYEKARQDTEGKSAIKGETVWLRKLKEEGE